MLKWGMGMTSQSSSTCTAEIALQKSKTSTHLSLAQLEQQPGLEPAGQESVADEGPGLNPDLGLLLALHSKALLLLFKPMPQFSIIFLFFLLLTDL